jgi:hypothetical protein
VSDGYVRQSSGLIVSGAVIQASHFNAEYNALAAAFSGSSGHDHSGGAGMGPIITPAGGGTPTFIGGTVTGTANALVVADTLPDNYTLVDKYSVLIRPIQFNTGPATVNVNGTGAKAIKKITPAGYADVAAGDLYNGQFQFLVYDAGSDIYQSVTTVYQATPTVTGSGFVVAFADLFKRYVLTSMATLTLPSVLIFPPYFYFEVQAKGGAVTLTPDAGDNINGGSDGASYVIAQGTSGVVYTDGTNWFVNGTANVQPIAAGGTAATTASGARTNLGLVIGTDVQAYDATLAALAGYNTNGIFVQTAADTFTGRTITGTASRLSVTNGSGVSGNPTLDIDSGYVGQASITTLGTISTGVWSGTTIATTKGGTGLTSYTTGDLIQATASNTLSALASVATGNALISGGVGTASSWGKIGLTTHVSGILPVANGGTGMAYFTPAGPTVARTYTFPDVDTTVLTTNSLITVAQGGTGLATLTANNVILGNGTSTPTFVAPSTSGNVLTSNGTTWQSTAPTPAIAAFHSTGLTIAHSTAGSVAHGLGGRPYLIQIRLRCTSAELGYSVGDEAMYSSVASDAGRGIQVFLDDTSNIEWICGGTIRILQKASGDGQIDPAKWQMYIDAYR